jgi:hypothetical protein
MEINYICSLGLLCHSANILKRNKIKLCSYPFDWVFSDCNNIIHCIEDKFNIFLNKSYYINLPNNRCGHSLYNNNMFYHHNPLNNENDYNYFVRCVDRFKKLLLYKEMKLFIMIYVNMNSIDEAIKNNIIEFNNKFSNYTNNYRLLVILHLPEKKNNYHKFTYYKNIHLLELHTLSKSTGLEFMINEDNIYLDKIIKQKYNFTRQIK